jgi:hypothetical protein
LPVAISPEDQKKLDTAKRNLQMVKDFKNVSNNVDGIVSLLEREANRNQTPIEAQTLRSKVARMARLLHNKQYVNN